MQFPDAAPGVLGEAQTRGAADGLKPLDSPILYPSLREAAAERQALGPRSAVATRAGGAQSGFAEAWPGSRITRPRPGCTEAAAVAGRRRREPVFPRSRSEERRIPGVSERPSDAEIGETGARPSALAAKAASAFVVVLALEWPKSASCASSETLFARHAIRSGSVNRPSCRRVPPAPACRRLVCPATTRRRNK